MKKVVRVFGTALLALCLAASLVACGDDKGGDKGDNKNQIAVVAVSAQSYTDVEKAVKAYLADELAYTYTETWGENNEYSDTEEVIRAQYVRHESKGAVETKTIRLSDAQKTDLVSAEKISVKAKLWVYPDSEEAGQSAAPAEATEDYETVDQTLYVLKYGDTAFKYMVSDPVTGERLTNSWLAQFTKTSDYVNSTLTSVEKRKEDDDEATTFEQARVYKFASNAAGMEMYADETRFNTRTLGYDDNTNDMVGYGLVSDSKVYSVMKMMGSEETPWNVQQSDGESISDIAEMTYGEYFDLFKEFPAAMFKKTADGFEATYSESEEYEKTRYVYETKVTVTVADGKITKAEMKNITTTTEGTETSTRENNQEVSVSAIGSTTVTVPSEVTEAVEAYVSAQ